MRKAAMARRINILYQVYILSSFLPRQYFPSRTEETNRMTAGVFLAVRGHTRTQRIQDMHFSLSVADGLSLLMAPAGQFAAQAPHFTHFFPAAGFSGIPL